MNETTENPTLKAMEERLNVMSEYIKRLADGNNPATPKGDPGYHPGVAAWETEPPMKVNYAEPVRVVEESAAENRRELFTITFGPDLSEESRKRITDFILFAPMVWQSLREAAQDLAGTEGGNGWAKFGDIAETLQMASGMSPFEDHPRENCDDELYRITNAAPDYSKLTDEERLAKYGATEARRLAEHAKKWRNRLHFNRDRD